MNVKEKFAAAKEKIKPYAPEIIVAVSVIVPVVIGIVTVKKLPSSRLEPMTPLDDAARDSLLKNKDFLLYQLSETEYLLDSQVPLK